jgi:hypothetical protein
MLERKPKVQISKFRNKKASLALYIFISWHVINGKISPFLPRIACFINICRYTIIRCILINSIQKKLLLGISLVAYFTNIAWSKSKLVPVFTIKAFGGGGGRSSFVTSTINGGVWVASRLVCCTLVEAPPLPTEQEGEWPKIHRARCNIEKILYLPAIKVIVSSISFTTRSLVTIPTTLCQLPEAECKK